MEDSHRHRPENEKKIEEDSSEIVPEQQLLQENNHQQGLCQSMDSLQQEGNHHQKGEIVLQRVPEAPGQLRVERTEGSCLLLSWQPPRLDPQGCSNGARVVGYRVYLNGWVCQQPHNPRLSSATIQVPPRRDPRRPHLLAMETLAACGRVSARVELVHHHNPACKDLSLQSFEAPTHGGITGLQGLKTL
ncbi:hypothetical protein ACOMHN_008674 [Nucella lapillus]